MRAPRKANEIEKKLTSGQTIIEIETELIENSFISDRLESIMATG